MGDEEKVRALVIMTRDQPLYPTCELGVGFLAFFTQVCQLDVSVMFTNEEAKVPNSSNTYGRSHR